MPVHGPVLATMSKYPPYISGHAMQAYWNSQALAALTSRAHHQVTYCGPVPAEFTDPGIVVHQVSAAAERNPKVLDGHLEKAVAGTLVDIALHDGVDTFLSYYADPHAGMVERARRTLRRLGVPVTVLASVEGSDLTDSLRRHVTDHEAAVIATDLLDADVLFAVSEFVARELAVTVREVFGDAVGDETEKRILVRYPGLPADHFVPADAAAQAAFRRGAGIEPDAVVASTYVRLVPEKGVLHLLDVAEHLAVRAPEVRVVIAGDGPLRDLLTTSIADRGLTTVRLVGHVEPHEAAVLRATSAIGVFPSRPTEDWDETFGISPLEYEALGVPVLVTHTGGTAESTACPEFRLPLTADAAEWAQATAALLAEPARWAAVASAFAAGFTAERAAGIILDAALTHRTDGRT